MPEKLEIIHIDRDIIVCIKPAGVLSTDEPGGMPELLRCTLGDEHANVRTVHRLDRVVSGLMVYARRKSAASELSRQIREGEFSKEYQAVVHGKPTEAAGTLIDLLQRNAEERKTYVAQAPGKDVQEAVLDYETLGETPQMTKVGIILRTGRTHQIRAQFSSRNLPLVGDKKYGRCEDDCEIALWSCRLSFNHPWSGEKMEFYREPPNTFPWNLF